MYLYFSTKQIGCTFFYIIHPKSETELSQISSDCLSHIYDRLSYITVYDIHELLSRKDFAYCGDGEKMVIFIHYSSIIPTYVGHSMIKIQITKRCNALNTGGTEVNQDNNSAH